jgi:flagellar hook assembly protein FlgD
MADHAPAKGKGLQIVFHMMNEGHAAIRVLAPNGVEVRRLFDGTMKTGSWSVDWDGRLTDGKSAQPGLYHIEVQTNGTAKSREVRIR